MSRSFAAFGLLIPAVASAQRPFRPDTTRLQQILVAEDARGTGIDGVKPLVDGAESADSMIRRVAVRGIGRLQRPDLARPLVGKLADRVAAVRIAAGDAMAQSVNRVTRRASDPGQGDVRWAAGVLAAALTAETDPRVADALAESIGRLPFGDSATAQMAQGAILAHGGTGFGAVHGLYWLAVNRATTAGLSAASVTRLRNAAALPNDAVVRRVAVLALSAAGALDSAMVDAASNDSDEQVRRLALGVARSLSTTGRARVLQKALGDSSAIVRVAAIPLMRTGGARIDCAPLIAAANDGNSYVALTAIDAIGPPCIDRQAASDALVRVVDMPAGEARRGALQMKAHSLVALARNDRDRAREPLRIFSASTEWLMRLYAARAAAIAADTAALLHLARDRDNNVREAAIAGLSALMKHGADSIYVAGLRSPGHQVKLAAATALTGSHDPAALPALFDVFDQLSRLRQENSRDARVAILHRITEMGSSDNAARLRPYLADFDTTIATTAAATLSSWTGTPVTARAERLPIHEEPLAQIFLARSIDLKVTMAASSGGGSFTIRLFNDDAPATAARIVRLAREHFYDGHLFQRVEPDFVVQGGGPDASEYVGDAQFMRDEIAWRSHLRGTLGISSRGRDTGDAQWFFNLTDNTRLDHEYTVFGEVTVGREVAERILEGDAIGTVEVVQH